MQEDWVPSLVRELDPTCRNHDLAHSNKNFFKKSLEKGIRMDVLF